MILLFDCLERWPEDHIIHFIQDYVCGVQGHLWRLLRMIPYNECLSSQTELVASERQNHCIFFYKCIFYQWNRFTVSGGRMKEGGGYGFSEAFILFRGFSLDRIVSVVVGQPYLQGTESVVEFWRCLMSSAFPTHDSRIFGYFSVAQYFRIFWTSFDKAWRIN